MGLSEPGNTDTIASFMKNVWNDIKKYDDSSVHLGHRIYSQANPYGSLPPQLENRPSLKGATSKLQSCRQEWFLAQKKTRKLKGDAAIWFGPYNFTQEAQKTTQKKKYIIVYIHFHLFPAEKLFSEAMALVTFPLETDLSGTLSVLGAMAAHPARSTENPGTSAGCLQLSVAGWFLRLRLDRLS